jgi:glucuronate isomerase
MSLQLAARLFAELDSQRLIDPHTHIQPLAPAATTLADILGYHYYTELAHSAGLPRAEIEAPGLSPRERVARLVPALVHLDNTVPMSWLLEMAREYWGFSEERLTVNNWEALFDLAGRAMAQPDWSRHVLDQSRLDAVFLTNDFDDPLAGFDCRVYVPCLRTDELVFHLARPAVRQRLAAAAGVEAGSLTSLRRAIAQRFEHFAARGARACAISLPPDFAPAPVEASEAERAWSAVVAEGEAAGRSERGLVGRWVFWTLAECCADFGLPLDLMIGVHRDVYAGGVHQGRDLFDGRVSLLQYRQLFNGFPRVTFPVSVLASGLNQELVSHAWIFPNVVAHGHWWYSNTPTYIEADAGARLEALPANKQIGYYSDMYKLEFALPKFRMYKRILARLLAQKFVLERGWSEERAVALGVQVLRGNVERVFGYA